jgi:hypothetical protein
MAKRLHQIRWERSQCLKIVRKARQGGHSSGANWVLDKVIREIGARNKA